MDTRLFETSTETLEFQREKYFTSTVTSTECNVICISRSIVAFGDELVAPRGSRTQESDLRRSSGVEGSESSRCVQSVDRENSRAGRDDFAERG